MMALGLGWADPMPVAIENHPVRMTVTRITR